jgi:hypothetical protein
MEIMTTTRTIDYCGADYPCPYRARELVLHNYDFDIDGDDWTEHERIQDLIMNSPELERFDPELTDTTWEQLDEKVSEIVGRKVRRTS